MAECKAAPLVWGRRRQCHRPLHLDVTMWRDQSAIAGVANARIDRKAAVAARFHRGTECVCIMAVGRSNSHFGVGLCAAGLCGPVLGAELGGVNTAPDVRMARRRVRGQTGLDIPGGVRKRNRRGLCRLRFAWLSGKATDSATAGHARLAQDERPQTNPLGPPASGASGAGRRGCPDRRPAARSAPARPCIHPNALRACAARRALPLAALLNRRSRLLSGLPAPLRDGVEYRY